MQSIAESARCPQHYNSIKSLLLISAIECGTGDISLFRNVLRTQRFHRGRLKKFHAFLSDFRPGIVSSE